jgi:hypothetical protein
MTDIPPHKTTADKLRGLWKQCVRGYITRDEDNFIEHCAESMDLLKARGDNYYNVVFEQVKYERSHKNNY